MKARKGFNMLEIIVGIVLVGIISVGVGNSASKNMKKATREAVQNELQMFSTNISNAYYDIGPPIVDAGDPNAQTKFENYLKTLAGEYMSVQFDMASLTPTTNGYSVEISQPLDAFESRYTCWFITDSSVMPYIMIASGGENGQIDSAGYSTQNYGDDLLLIVKPKD